MHPESRSKAAVPSTTLLVIGVCLTVGFACAMVAALHPSLSSVWTTGGSRAINLIADGRKGAWQLANWMFAIGVWFTLAGLAALTMLLVRRTRNSLLPGLALMLATVAATLWTVNLAFRLTATVRIVDAVAAGNLVPGWYSDVEAWAGTGMLNSAGLIGGTAMSLYGLAVLGGGVVARWTGWFAAACGLALLGEVVLTGDVVPALLYLAPLPLGITALLRAARAATQP